MKESNIRKWHRNLGILLALFIVFQAGSGLLITLNDLSVPHSHAHGDGPGHVKNHEAEKTIRHESYPDEDFSDHAQGHSAKRPTWWADSLGGIHHGGGAVRTVYRLLVGIGILAMAVSGSIIFFKIRGRTKRR